MARARKGRTRRRRRRERTGESDSPTRAELGLLKLAREIAALARDAAGPAALGAALEKLTTAFTASALEPVAMLEALKKSRDSKTRLLALGWAREQLRLALQELIQRAADAGRARTDMTPATLAWLLLAGCQALAYEPPTAVQDRAAALLDFTHPPRPLI